MCRNTEQRERNVIVAAEKKLQVGHVGSRKFVSALLLKNWFMQPMVLC